MNISEKKACHWMMSCANLEPEQIIWNGGSSPDFLCTDGRSFEVKTMWGGCIAIGETQYPKLLNRPNCTILVFKPECLLPVAIIPISDIASGSLKNDSIRITFQRYTPHQPLVSKHIIREEHRALFAHPKPIRIITKMIGKAQPYRMSVLITPETL